ncbi:D-glycero-beta-D-manno-heptose 1-phosphate adenylyltransferase [Limibacter armeniacum]|uniref:D-glycero-beta-D-manno-heptose 1-phosphate adenylyltransferase n=1 Tax=Limibacter armeniacum TaxID=466084 RepID=UPI002FE6140F
MKNTAEKLYTLDQLKEVRNQWKKEGLKVVFTNGCFDILHLGHIDYLEKARQKGDKLIIGLNTDASVSKLKGPERPINNEYARGRMLAALAFVDAVVPFGEETPFELISELIPDTLVKGSDYTVDTIVGADIVMANGGTVETIDLVDGYSTTNIIQKIQK